MINQGFDYKDIKLDKDIPEDVSILVIAEMREPMTDAEKIYLDRYIARGGNLMIIGEPKRREVMMPLMEQFGVKFVDGFLVQPPKEMPKEENKQDNINLGPFAGLVAPANPMDLILARVTIEAKKLSYPFGLIPQAAVVTMPTAAGLEYTEDKGFKVVPLLVTDSICWNELETIDVIDQEVTCNPTVGEVKKSYNVGLALSRNIADREQKIIILGDADCLSDGEFNRSRGGVWAMNYVVVQGGFNWLSDGEAPIDIRRPNPIDNQIFVKETGADVLKYSLMAVFPGILLFLALFIWLRRRGR